MQRGEGLPKTSTALLIEPSETGENRGAILLKREIVARRFVRGADPLVEEVDDADLGGGG